MIAEAVGDYSGQSGAVAEAATAQPAATTAEVQADFLATPLTATATTAINILVNQAGICVLVVTCERAREQF